MTIDFRDPASLLASAVDRINQADLILAEELVSLPPDERIMYALESAGVLAQLAEAAVSAAAEERCSTPTIEVMANPDADGDFWADTVGPKPYVPQPVQGRRFVVDFVGQSLGTVGGRDVLCSPRLGFLDVTGGHTTPGTAATADGTVSIRLEGRIVSALPDQILGVTDAGTGVALSRSLISEVDDE